jgi:AraC family transcriptional regulator
MLLENQTASSGSTSTGASRLVSHLAQILQTARSKADTDYEATKRLVTEASLMLELHLARNAMCTPGQYGLRGLARWQIERVRAFIEEHLTEGIRVSDLSAIARSSPSYFSCAFKRSFGSSPHAFIMARRIQKAAEMMLNSEAPLSEIAINCGFADQAHFSRQFRKTMGYTPSIWRRERAAQPFAR